jgi:putative pyoverdin transport system ATP-binding/permease protein
MEFIKFLWQVSWKQILIASGAGLVGGCSNAVMISIINREVHQEHFANAVFYFILLAILITIASIVAQFVLIRLSQNAIYQLRLQLSKNILASPLEHLEKLKENRLIVMLTDDINSLTRSVAAIPNIFIDFATVVSCFIYLAWVSNVIFTIAITSTVISILFVQSQLNKGKKLFTDAREEEDTLFKHFQGIINGIKELKLNRLKREEFTEKNLKGSAAKLRQKNTKAAESFIIANGFGQMLQFAGSGFILFILPSLIHIPLPILAGYVLIGTFIALPIQNLLNRIPELVRGNVALRKIERMNLALISIAEVDRLPAPILTNCHLQLHGVIYRYQPDLPPSLHSDRTEDRDRPPLPQKGLPKHPQQVAGDRQPDRLPPPPGANDRQPDRLPPPHPKHPQGPHPHPHPSKPGSPPGLQHDRQFSPNPNLEEPGFLLGPIDLEIGSGELVFIVGSNGSGKSTLAKLITGLYPAQSGEIYLNGEPITEANVEWYRQHFATTFSDIHLFDSYLGFADRDSASVANLQLDREVSKYLREFQLDRKVSVNNGVLSTTSLSQGQRKRLALLSAFLEDRPIYLFDEWASDQDPAFRELFYNQILIQLKERGKLVIAITHDDRYFHLADRILKLNYGRVELIDRSTPTSGTKI